MQELRKILHTVPEKNSGKRDKRIEGTLKDLHFVVPKNPCDVTVFPVISVPGAYQMLKL